MQYVNAEWAVNNLKIGEIAIATDYCSANVLAEASKQIEPLFKYKLYTSNVLSLFPFGKTVVAVLTHPDLVSTAKYKQSNKSTGQCKVKFYSSDEISITMYDRCFAVNNLKNVVSLVQLARSVLIGGVSTRMSHIVITITNRRNIGIDGLFAVGEFGYIIDTCKDYLDYGSSILVTNTRCIAKLIEDKIKEIESECSKN